ncbi:hypothetical protein [Brevundimonas faecalis]|uniref:Flagellar protein FliT n=1 Tax=Brevundimonas faecalis TaxID=947378 RepID=A0ABV2R9Z8_9CAUL
MRPGFNAAVENWRRLSTAAKEDAATWDRFAEAELQILSHQPQDLAQAGLMLEVLIDQIDGRSDGLDVKALQEVHRLLLRQSLALPAAPAPRTAAAAGRHVGGAA